MTLTEPTPTHADAGVDALFAPTELAGIALGNAFAMAPMTRFRSPGGVPGPDVAAYYRRRAAGGVGLIITEGILVDHPSAGAEDAAPRLERPAAEAGWRIVADQVHAAGSKIIAQLWHQGSEREGFDGGVAWTPSGVREDGSPAGRAATIADLDELISRYAAAAGAARRAGFDGVEVHAAHGYLLDEFLWRATNRRTDRYGGTPRNRARLVAEIVAAIRAEVGAGFPVGLRFSQFKERDFDAVIADHPDELAALLTPAVEAGVTLLHASARRFWRPAFDGSPRTLAGWGRDLTGLPAIAVGSFGLSAASLADPERSLAAVARLREAGEFDARALGRPLLANPCWVNHVRRGELGALIDYSKEQEEVFA